MKIKLTVFCVLIVMTLALYASALNVGASSFPIFVSEYFLLDKDYEPVEKIDISKHIKTSRSPLYMEKEAGQHFIEMMSDCKKDGITNAFGQSGLRSYSYQQGLFSNKINNLKKSGLSSDKAYSKAKTVVALPGGSEHQTGLAVDISIDGSLTEKFASTKAGKWLAENSYKYGFILRYPKDKTDITGIIFEPWHFRYVGETHAKIMYNQNLCLEEYYGKYAPLSTHFLSEYIFVQLSLEKLSENAALNPDRPVTIGEFLKLCNIDHPDYSGIDYNNNITRSKAAVIIGKIMNINIDEENENAFSDTEHISINERKYLSALEKRYIFCRFENNSILPDGFITVGQAANIACYLDTLR